MGAAAVKSPRTGTGGLTTPIDLVLGGNTFGWTSDRPTSETVLDAFTAGGGGLIDTADSYSAWVDGNSGGESEEIIGDWMAARGNRDDLVIATKVSQHPLRQGLSAVNIAAAVDESLTRLRTDRIDVYYAHFDDPSIQLAETVSAFNELVTAGKIGAVGLSNFGPHRIQEWCDIARSQGFAAPVALQPHYNLVTRVAYETQVAPTALAEGLEVYPYFSLASGFLTGKYRSLRDLSDGARAEMVHPYSSDAAFGVVDALVEIATARDVAPATVALSWLRTQPGVVAPIASARSIEQVPALLASATFELDESERTRLDTLSSRVAA